MSTSIRIRFAGLVLLPSLLVAAGCAPTPPATFRLNMVEATSPSAEKDSVSADLALTTDQKM